MFVPTVPRSISQKYGLTSARPKPGHGRPVAGRVGRDLEHLGDPDGGQGGFVEADSRGQVGHGDVQVVDAGA
jgi:hypothetical protein